MESIDRHTFWTLHRNFISNIVHDYFPLENWPIQKLRCYDYVSKDAIFVR